MTDVRVLRPLTVPEPTGSSHAATKNYVDIAAIPVAARGAANGVAPLNSGLLVPIAYLPATGPTDYPSSVGDFNNPGTSGLLSRADHTHNGVPTAHKGAANGVATLDASTKIPIAQIPTGTSSSTVSLGDHTHAISALTGTAIAAPASGDVLSFNGSNWVNTSVGNSVPSEAQLHGDVMSPIKREQATNSTTMDNGYYTVSGLVATKTVTVTSVRFFVAAAGTAGGAPTFSLGVYTGSSSTVTRQAVANVTATNLTSTGLKQISLANSVSITAGQRVYFVAYVAPSSYTAVASLACSATYWGALVNASNFWQGYKSAAVATPTTINVSDGTWSASASTVWWSVL